MNRSQRSVWLATTVIFAVCLVTIGLSHFVTDPGHVFPEMGGDGAKNAFTYLYHSMYGKGYWFTGMNYPYGEHILFTDGIPLLSVFFTSIGNVSSGTALTVLWWAVALSYVLSIVYMYKALLRMGLSPLWAMLGAGLICMMTPQWIRLRGHYGLSFVCIVPMLLCWTLAWYQDRKNKYWIYVFLLGMVFSFLHPYYAGIVLVWVFAFAAGFLLLEKGALKHKVKLVLPACVAAVAVPAVVMVIMKLTDPVTDRLPTPYSSDEGFSTSNRLLSAVFSPFWEFVGRRDWVHNVADGGEGFGYIGLVPIVVLATSVVVYFMRRKAIGRSRSSLTWLALFMAFGIAAFSMGVPMRWHIPGMMKVLFAFKQFRTIGRFAWMSYYIIGAFSVVAIYHWYQSLVSGGRRKLAVGLLSLGLLVWSAEVFGYIRAMRKVAEVGRYNHSVMFSTQEKNWRQFLAEHGKKADDFQALLLLKYFNVGTDKLWIGEPGWLITLGTRAATQLHLPIIDAMMARSSISRAQDLAKTVAGPYAEKPLLQMLKSDKPFLLLNYDVDSLSPDEGYLLQASDYIGEFSQCKVYACYPQRIRVADKAARDSVKAIAKLLAPGADTCIGDCGAWYVQHFSTNLKPEWRNDGMGGIDCIAGHDSVVASIPVTTVKDSVIYEFSCWFLLEHEDYRSPDVVLQMQGADGKTLSEITVKTHKAVDSRGRWYRASAYFYMPATCRRVQCRVINDPAPAYVAMDELLLRPAGGTVISVGRQGQVLVNGHLLSR